MIVVIEEKSNIMAEEMNQQGQGGSGSAENKGDGREAQKATLTTLD